MNANVFSYYLLLQPWQIKRVNRNVVKSLEFTALLHLLIVLYILIILYIWLALLSSYISARIYVCIRYTYMCGAKHFVPKSAVFFCAWLNFTWKIAHLFCYQKNKETPSPNMEMSWILIVYFFLLLLTALSSNFES